MYSDNSPSLPSVEDYKEAFSSILESLPDSYIRMLCAQYHAPNRALTARELAKEAKYKNCAAANLHYGKLGRRLREEMAYFHLEGQLSFILSSFAPPGEMDNDEWLFVMHPEVVQALEELNLCSIKRNLRGTDA